ncbi:hypothetical protein GCM10023238_39340 [Streptomyces heliomycini]
MNAEKRCWNVLLDAALSAPPTRWSSTSGGTAGETPVTFRLLLEDSLRVAAVYRGRGSPVAGTCRAGFADRGEDFQPLFWGALAAGLVPVPLAPDVRRVRAPVDHSAVPGRVDEGAPPPPLRGRWPAGFPEDAVSLRWRSC